MQEQQSTSQNTDILLALIGTNLEGIDLTLYDLTCAWCLGKLGITPKSGSHGMCQKCRAEFMGAYNPSADPERVKAREARRVLKENCKCKRTIVCDYCAAAQIEKSRPEQSVPIHTLSEQERSGVTAGINSWLTTLMPSEKQEAGV